MYSLEHVRWADARQMNWGCNCVDNKNTKCVLCCRPDLSTGCWPPLPPTRPLDMPQIDQAVSPCPQQMPGNKKSEDARKFGCWERMSGFILFNKTAWGYDVRPGPSPRTSRPVTRRPRGPCFLFAAIFKKWCMLFWLWGWDKNKTL